MNKYTTTGGFLLLIIVIFVIGTMVYHQDSSFQTVSTFSLSPTPVVSPTKEPEPDITSWATYNNDKYNFTLDYPAGWNQQEYTGPYGATLIAFSPVALPCKDCSYVHNGYYSIKIYNQKTDPQAYTDFTTRMKSIGRSPQYIGIQLNNKPGVLFANTVALENNGYVYELALDKDNGTDKATDSKLFQKSAVSLRFTNLIFTN